MKYVITTVWVEHTVVEASSVQDAYDKAEPEPREGLSLSNWHVAAVGDNQKTGGLNYRQLAEDDK